MTRLGIAATVVAVAAIGVSFAAWSDAAETSHAQTRSDGADIFLAKGCASCHDGPDTTAPFGVAPSLARASEWAADREASLGAREYIERSIREPSAFVSPVFRANGPTTAMPTLELSPAEIDALVGYLLEK